MGIIKDTQTELRSKKSKKVKWSFLNTPRNRQKLKSEFSYLMKEDFIKNIEELVKFTRTAMTHDLGDLNNSINFSQFIESLIEGFPPAQLSDDIRYESSNVKKLSRIPQIRIENNLLKFRLRHSRININLNELKNRITQPGAKTLLEKAIEDIDNMIKELEDEYSSTTMLGRDMTKISRELIKLFSQTKVEINSIKDNLFTFDNDSVTIFAAPRRKPQYDLTPEKKLSQGPVI